MVRTGEAISLKTRQGCNLGLRRWLHLPIHLYTAPGRLQESGKEELQGTSRYSQCPVLTWCWVKFPHTCRQQEAFKALQKIYIYTYTATCGTVLPWSSQLPSETSVSLAAKKMQISIPFSSKNHWIYKIGMSVSGIFISNKMQGEWCGNSIFKDLPPESTPLHVDWGGVGLHHVVTNCLLHLLSQQGSDSWSHEHCSFL